MSEQRRGEAFDAASLMRIERLEWLGLREGEWQTQDLRDSLAALLDQIAPDVVYAPSRIDFHPEHRRVAHALALALSELRTRQRHGLKVRIYQVQVPLTSVVTNLVADVSAHATQCDAVMRAYVSQAGSVRCGYRLKRYCARWYGIADQAEVFWEMPADRYSALHRSPPAQWPDAFRSLRYAPFTDPLAFLVGRRARRSALARMTQA